MTPDSRTELQRLNAVLFHLAKIKEHVSALAASRIAGPGPEPVGFHISEAERQVIDLFNDAGERELVAKVGR